MRDRLLELLCKVNCKGEEDFLSCPYRSGGRCIKIQRLEMCCVFAIVDYLLAEGVVALPCKVGDTIYMPWRFDGVKGVASLCVSYIVIDKDELRIMTDFSTDSEEFFDLYNGGKFNPSDFGKTVFLTLEEARRANDEEVEE